MKLKRTILAPIVVAVIGLATGGWFLQRGADPQQNVYMQARLFQEVMNRVSADFVDAKNPKQLYHMAIEGMLDQLGDPHTVFLTPTDYSQLHIETSGEYGGVGMQIDVRDGWLTVISPLPGTPAERAGLRAGDRIIAVNDTSTRGWTNDEAVAHLRGPAGTSVDLKVDRPGLDGAIPFHVTRANIHVKSVPTAYMLDKKVGYVNLTVFAETSTEEMRKAIDKLKSEGMKGLIIDIRHNPGGLLDQGVGLSDLFLNKGQLVVQTRGRMQGMTQKYFAETKDQFPGLPIVLLVDPYSASASEIFSGALQDHDRALLVGQTTYGKGSVQSLFRLSGGNFLKLTTGRWYTPSGRSIQKPFDGHANGMTGDSTSVASNVPDSLTIYHTDDGRTVYGGGGIRPDVIVKPDSVTAAERDLARALERFGSKFNSSVTSFAARYVNTHPHLTRNFQVTPAMLGDFYDALRKDSVDVSRQLYDGARSALTTRLVSEITYAKWGEAGRRERANLDDPQVKVAREVLDKATTPSSVFAVVKKLRADGVLAQATPPSRGH